MKNVPHRHLRVPATERLLLHSVPRLYSLFLNERTRRAIKIVRNFNGNEMKKSIQEDAKKERSAGSLF